MNRRLDGYDIVVPFYLPWNWSADYQRQTCLELAKKYKVIAYLKKDRKFFLKAFFGKKEEYPKIKNITFYVPLDYIPFQRFDFIRNLNDILSFKIMEIFYLNPKHKLLWIFDPLFYPLLLMFKGITIYDCVDFMGSTEKNLDRQIKLSENKLIKEVDYFFVNSHVLSDYHKGIRKPSKIVPQGFSVDTYDTKFKSRKRFPGPNPVVGFIGAVNQRIDFNLFKKLVERNPKWNFVLWGRAQDNSVEDKLKTEKELKILTSYKNFFRGESDRSELPAIVREFNVAVIPYDMSQEFNKYCYPMKLFEYFYLGRPVVSTSIEELKRFPDFVRIGESVTEWEKNIDYWLKHPLSPTQIKKMMNLAIQNSWHSKVSKILEVVNLG